MTHDTNIPQGYKATALGIIPAGVGGYAVRRHCINNQRRKPVPIPPQGRGEISICQGRRPEQIREKYQESSREYSDDNNTTIKAGSIIFPKRGASILNNKVRIAAKDIQMDSNMMAITPHTTIVDTEFLYIRILHERLYRIADTSSIPQINNKHIIPYKIAVPPLAEQRKIAEVLGVWDEAIEKQARLIEKLALRKRALMQRLLSAKLRLPGFSEPWEKVKLGDIGHFLSSNTLSRDCLNEQIGNIKNIHYGDILIKLPTIVDASFIHIPYVNDDVIVKSDYLKNGDIIFADTAEDYTVGKAIEIINIQAIPVTSGLHTIPFRPKSGIFVNRFLGYYVNSTDYRRQLQPLIQGIKVYSISKTALCKTTLKIPTLSEQTAIAEVLTAADREIELAKEKLERLRRQKRGLMQQLLTGKRRIKY